MKSILCLLVIIIFSLTNTDQILGEEEPDEEEPDAVLDSNGDKLSAGTEYYIFPILRHLGGGVTLASTGEKRCPLDVVQARFPTTTGLPLTFTPVNSKTGVITESTDLNIKFSATPVNICDQTTVWTLSNQSSDGQYYITTGGTEGNPGIDTLSNWFKIKKKNNIYYKLVYCPTVCNNCEVMCEDIGSVLDSKNQVWRLTLSYSSLMVSFLKKNAKAEAKAES